MDPTQFAALLDAIKTLTQTVGVIGFILIVRMFTG